MKKFLLVSLTLSMMICSGAFAGKKDHLGQLDEEGKEIALHAITHGYNINWNKFDFRKDDQDARATQVSDCLNAILEEKIQNYITNMKKIGEVEDPVYKYYAKKKEKYEAKLLEISYSWSKASSKAWETAQQLIQAQIPVQNGNSSRSAKKNFVAEKVSNRKNSS